MEVKIYIETSLCGPCVKDGWYAYILECQTKKGPATAGDVGMEKETTYYRTVLLAILDALKRIKRPCDVKIYTSCHFVKGIYDRGQIEQWQRAEWTKASGEEVANKELWQQFFQEVKRMGGKSKIAFRYSKFNDYRGLMQEMMREQIAEQKNAS